MKKLTMVIAIMMLATLLGCAIPTPARQEQMAKNQTTMVKNESIVTQTNETMMAKNETMMEKNATNEPAPKTDLKDVPKKEVVEGDLVNFPNLKATDPDGDPITYTFTAPFDEHGKWQTKAGDAGDHLVSITATDGTNTVSQQVLIVVRAKNRAPEIKMESTIEIDEAIR